MINNDALPDIRVDPETFAITSTASWSSPRRPTALPLAQLYAMF